MKYFLIIFLFLLLALTAACAPDQNTMEKTGDSHGETAGFWRGLWHGLIILFTFIISLFKESVGIYEIHNNGTWYNLGFLLGVMIFFGGSGKGSGCKGK